jgi:hypothetical protein
MAVPYMSACMMYRDHAGYLEEWIEFHRLVGVERFFLYDNQSSDDHRAVLAPYVDAGLVVLHDWPAPFSTGKGMKHVEGLTQAYEHCLREHRADSRWIAFIDVDEFLFSPTGRPVSEILHGYEQFPAVGVGWVAFGTSGHVAKPPGLVTESYLLRSEDEHLSPKIKSVVDPTRTLRCLSPHHFEYRDGLAVDELRRPIEGWETDSPSFTELRVNHYWTKSEEEFRRKFELFRAVGYPRPWSFFEERNSQLSKRDETILRYLPELRAALRKTGSATPPGCERPPKTG